MTRNTTLFISFLQVGDVRCDDKGISGEVGG
jgi:hypothetical protein